MTTKTTDRKPYVPHKGIKREPLSITLGKFGERQISDWTPGKVQGRRVVKAGTVNGTPLYVDLDRHPEIEAQINAANAAYEQAFIARYPGIYELVAARNDAEYRYERLQRAIERGDGILPSSTPDRDPEELARQYPLAAAYLTICGYCDSDNLDKYGAGQWAIEQLEAGADVLDTCNAMQQRWHSATNEHIWD